MSPRLLYFGRGLHEGSENSRKALRWLVNSCAPNKGIDCSINGCLGLDLEKNASCGTLVAVSTLPEKLLINNWSVHGDWNDTSLSKARNVCRRAHVECGSSDIYLGGATPQFSRIIYRLGTFLVKFCSRLYGGRISRLVVPEGRLSHRGSNDQCICVHY